MSQSQIPPIAWRYFHAHPLIKASLAPAHPHPLVSAVFSASTGWKRYPGRKRVTASWLRKLAREGYTDVTLSSLGVSADFRIAELLRTR